MPSRRIIPVLAALCAIALAGVIFVVSRRPATPAPAVAVAPVPVLGGFTVPPPPAQLAAHLRPALMTALGHGVPATWAYRTNLIRALPPGLAAIETDALLAAMMAPCPPSVSTGVHSTYMHEIACVLHSCPDVRECFARALATLARDSRRDAATRDYAIQHLRHAWTLAADDPALRAAVVATFREFSGSDPVVANAALLSLHLLGSPGLETDAKTVPGQPRAQAAASGNPPPAPARLPDSELAPLLEPIFATGNSRASVPARLTAIRIVGERRMKAFRQHLLKALNDRLEHSMVRMAAANALGKISDPAEMQALASLDTGDPRVATALRQALAARATR